MLKKHRWTSSSAFWANWICWQKVLTPKIRAFSLTPIWHLKAICWYACFMRSVMYNDSFAFGPLHFPHSSLLRTNCRKRLKTSEFVFQREETCSLGYSQWVERFRNVFTVDGLVVSCQWVLYFNFLSQKWTLFIGLIKVMISSPLPFP